MEIKQNWDSSDLELYLLKDFIKPISALYILVGLNGSALESEKGGFMKKSLKEIYYALDPSVFPSYTHVNLSNDEALSERIAISRMYSDFDKLRELWASSQRVNEFERPGEMIDWALSKRYAPAWLDWAISKKLYVPSREMLDIFHEIKISKLKDKPKAAADGIKKWLIPGSMEYQCRKIGKEFIESMGLSQPTIEEVAKHVEKVLKESDIRGVRDDYWSWKTIKREALSGIMAGKGKRK